jgi:hypothetical protein
MFAEHELPQFPVDGAVFIAVQERVQAARQLESLEHTQRRGQAEESWLTKAALELDLHFDEHDKLYPFCLHCFIIVFLYSLENYLFVRASKILNIKVSLDEIFLSKKK